MRLPVLEIHPGTVKGEAWIQRLPFDLGKRTHDQDTNAISLPGYDNRIIASFWGRRIYWGTWEGIALSAGGKQERTEDKMGQSVSWLSSMLWAKKEIRILILGLVCQSAV